MSGVEEESSRTMTFVVEQKGKPMDELINKQAVIDAIYNTAKIFIYCDSDKVIKTIKELPPVQLEIIRCKECKWYNDRERTCNDLMGFGRYWKPDDFCSYGRRKINE